MNDDERTALLREIAGEIMQRRMRAPARMALDIVAPLGFLAGQLALFTRPLLPPGRWRNYATVLEDERAWSLLQTLVRDSDG
jgi:hypothetical protein